VSALQSFRFTSEEWGGKKHDVEWQGYNPGDAAKRLAASDARLVRIYNANPKHRGDPQKWNKLMWFRQGHNQDACETEMGLKIMAARMDTAHMILDQLVAKGIKLRLLEEPQEDGTTSTTLINQGLQEATEEQTAEIEAHKDSLIALLKERRDAAKAEPKPEPKAKAPKPKPNKPPSQRQIVIDLFTQLGTGNFIKYDVQRLLHKGGHHDFADNEPSVDFILADLEKKGLLTRVRRGVYRVATPEADKSPEAPPPLELNPAPAAPPAAPPPDSAPVVAAPEAIRQPEPAPAATPAAIPLNGLKNPVELIVGLTSALLAAPLEEGEITAVEAALLNFSTDMMQAVEKLETTVRPMIQQLRAQSKARRYLREQIAAPAN
jgi:hypothetical protein